MRFNTAKCNIKRVLRTRYPKLFKIWLWIYNCLKTRNLKGCPERLKQTAYLSLILSFMEPLFGTSTKSTTVRRLRGCIVKLQGSSKVGIQDTLVFLICLMCWGGRFILKGDRRLDLFCFTKLLTVWHKSLLRHIRVLEENTI